MDHDHLTGVVLLRCPVSRASSHAPRAIRSLRVPLREVHGGDHPDVLHEGYCNEDRYCWICENCFGAFREGFGWTLLPGDEAVSLGRSFRRSSARRPGAQTSQPRRGCGRKTGWRIPPEPNTRVRRRRGKDAERRKLVHDSASSCGNLEQGAFPGRSPGLSMASRPNVS